MLNLNKYKIEFTENEVSFLKLTFERFTYNLNNLGRKLMPEEKATLSLANEILKKLEV